MPKMILITLVTGFICFSPLSGEVIDYKKSTEPLFLQDIPVFVGLDYTQKRLRTASKKHPLWALNLSGGSARAFAHVGVLKRLEEAGLRPDAIITNSMGSIVGMAYAAGMSPDDIEDILNSITLSHFFNLEFPFKGGIINIRRFRALIQEIIGTIDISSSPIPVFVVTEDLISKRQIIFSKGDFIDILTAAFALPVYFNPVEIDGYRLIDGGVSNLVPLKPFESILPNMVVSSTFYSANVDLDNPVTILNVTMDISKTRRAVRQIKQYSPFLIRCDVEKISFMDFDNSEFIIQKGYDSCNENIPDLVAFLENRGIHPTKENLKTFDVTAQYHERWSSLKKRIHYTALPMDKKGSSSFMGLINWKSYRSDHYLKDDIYLEEANIIWNTRVSLGGSIYTNFNDSSGIRLMATYIPNSFMALSSDTLLSFNLSDSNSVTADEAYFSGILTTVFPLENIVLRPLLSIEDSYLAGDKTNRLLIRPKLTLNYYFYGMTPLRPVKFEHSFGSYHDYKSGAETGMGISAEQSISLPLTGLFTYKNRELAKFSLGKSSSSAQLSYTDFFRSSDTTFFNAADSYYPSYFILNNSINFRAGKYLPTFGEMLNLGKTDIFLFTDVFISSILPGQQGKSVHTSMGGGINFNASLIGLAPWEASLFGGYDFYRDSFFFSLNIN